MGRTEEAAKLQYELQKLEFKLKLEEFKLSIQHFYLIGAISAEIASDFLGILREANMFEWPDFVPPGEEEDDDGGGGGGGGTHEDPFADLRRALDRLRSAINALREFNEGLTQGNLTPLSIADQFAEAQANYQAVLAAAMAGDIGAIESLPEAAQAFLELAAQMFGTGGLGYQNLFNTLRENLDDVVGSGEALLNALPQEFQEVVDRLDTISEILDFLRDHGIHIIMPPGGENVGMGTALGTGNPFENGGTALFNMSDDDYEAMARYPGDRAAESRAQLESLACIERRLQRIESNTKVANDIAVEGQRQVAHISATTPAAARYTQPAFTRRRGG
jgi:hypothetical protein